MNIKQFGNNKAVAVYDGKTDWLFSYGTLILCAIENTTNIFAILTTNRY